jgi:hypothetical protein
MEEDKKKEENKEEIVGNVPNDAKHVLSYQGKQSPQQPFSKPENKPEDTTLPNYSC